MNRVKRTAVVAMLLTVALLGMALLCLSGSGRPFAAAEQDPVSRPTVVPGVWQITPSARR